MTESAPRQGPAANPPRHSSVVRTTHWLTTLCFFLLLLTGVEILISHPRFYWGETGNVLMPALFELPIPASRGSVKTGYSFVLKDQNSWSRSLHFQAGWLLFFTALVYAVYGLRAGHFRKNLLPARGDASWRAFATVLKGHLRFEPVRPTEETSYNVLQRLSYLSVILFLFPLAIWTGLAMSPGFTAAFPSTVTVFGGQQSARTIHFFATIGLILFVGVHVTMVVFAGFRKRMRPMLTGRPPVIREVS